MKKYFIAIIFCITMLFLVSCGFIDKEINDSSVKLETTKGTFTDMDNIGNEYDYAYIKVGNSYTQGIIKGYTISDNGMIEITLANNVYHYYTSMSNVVLIKRID